MLETPLPANPRIEFLFRDPCPSGSHCSQSTVYAELLALSERCPALSLAAGGWSAQIPVTEGEEPATDADWVREKVEAFEQWAIQHDRSLAPAFERRELAATPRRPARDCLVLPVLCLAVYDDEAPRNDALHAVFPSNDGRTVRTVGDGLDLLVSNLEPRDTDQSVQASAHQPSASDTLDQSVDQIGDVRGEELSPSAE